MPTRGIIEDRSKNLECRYCGDGTEEVELIQHPKRMVIKGELVIMLTNPTYEAMLPPYICLNCLCMEVTQAHDGRWPSGY